MYPSAAHPLDGSFVHEQVESVRALGVEVDVFHIDGRSNRANYLSAFHRLSGHLHRHRYDLLHSHHSYCMYPIAFARKLLHRRTPVLFTFHESEFLKPPAIKDETADAVKRLVYSRRIKLTALAQADLVIPVWEGLTRELGYHGDQVVLPCGTDTAMFRPMDRDACRREIGIGPDEKVVFFPAYIFDAGSKRQFKGVDLFQAAVARVTDAVAGARVITGGSIPRERMPHHMNAADVIVQTSAFEASPMVIKEAMAVNTPIVSLDVGDTRDVVGDTAGCHIVAADPDALANAIVTALDHGRTHGRERLLALGLDIHQVAERLRDVYTDALSRYAPAGVA